MTKALTPEQTSDLIYGFLKAGVPPTAVARAMELDVEYVKDALSLMHVDRYGTDEIEKRWRGSSGRPTKKP